MPKRSVFLGTARLLVGMALPCVAQTLPAPPHTAFSDASVAAWAASYAPGCQPTTHHCGATGTFIWDPQFTSLITHHLAKQQSWWFSSHGGSTSVLSLARAFLGITDDKTYFDENRYLTVSGCVPHACTSKGMLWVDTGTHPATVILVAENFLVGPGKDENGYHLYLYTSRELATYYAGKRPIGIFDPNFLQHLAQWRAASTSKDDEQNMILATVVWPDGTSWDRFPSDLFGHTTQTPDHLGASK